ncbi:MAG: LysM peptidoglycan-binding domain-containing protein [Clostridia bacterium]
MRKFFMMSLTTLLLTLAFSSNCLAAVTPSSISISLDTENANKGNFKKKDFCEIISSSQKEMERHLIEEDFMSCLYTCVQKDFFSPQLFAVEEDYCLGNEFFLDKLTQEATGIQILGFVEKDYAEDFVNSFEKDAAKTFVEATMPLSSRIDLKESIVEDIQQKEIPIFMELSFINEEWCSIKLNFNLYEVSEDETLSAIAEKFNIPVSELAEKNGITNRNQLFVGDVLIIR